MSRYRQCSGSKELQNRLTVISEGNDILFAKSGTVCLSAVIHKRLEWIRIRAMYLRNHNFIKLLR